MLDLLRMNKKMNKNTYADNFFFPLDVFFLIVFLFGRYFCLLRHFEIIRCIVKSLIAIQHIFVAVQLKAPRPVYPYLKQTGYVTKNTCVRVFLMKLQALRPATLLKSVSKAGVLLLI